MDYGPTNESKDYGKVKRVMLEKFFVRKTKSEIMKEAISIRSLRSNPSRHAKVSLCVTTVTRKDIMNHNVALSKSQLVTDATREVSMQVDAR